ncbi:MAG: SGNH/GDSL hydrolase family protein [Bacteroidales bacterium]|nr:SGNH/GDSL hydrolase family protein [Bacteroidales bacterium]
MKIKHLQKKGRKSLIVALVASTILLTFSFMMKKPTRIIFFGDSITEMGVQQDGYIDKMQSYLIRKGLDSQFELLGAGIGGNKVYDLYLRLEEDVLSKDPDIVIVWVGVNDVWHKVWGTGTDADKFEKFYTAVINKIKAGGAEVILCTPAVIGERTDYTNQLDGDLNLYSQIIRDLAAANQCKLVDLRQLFLAHNLQNNTKNLEKGILTTDGVHLNDEGNQLAADAMLSAIFPEYKKQDYRSKYEKIFFGED